jgi:hypothetical protein
MKVRAGLLQQLERCSLSAQLAAEHDETSESAERGRLIRTEVTRAWAVQDRGTIPEAQAALAWLRGELAQRNQIHNLVGEPVDLVDPETGEVLVSGRPGAVLFSPNLVVAWKTGDPRGIGEPEDDLGLIAMGLAAFDGQPFQTCYVAFDGLQAFPRRSPVFEPESHAGLLARIKAAEGRPPVACPGDWCSECKVNLYCPAWRARADVAIMVLPKEMREGAEKLEITNQNSGALMQRIKDVEAAAKLARDLLKAHVRGGGECIVDGKRMVLGFCEGKETPDLAALKAAGLTQYIRKGDPYETSTWKNVQSAEPARAKKKPAATLVKS